MTLVTRLAVLGMLAWSAFAAPSTWAEDAAKVHDPQDRAAALEFFEKRIRPLLVDNCFTCHSAETNSKGGLRVDDRNGLIHGGESGPAIVPGKPAESLLLRAVSYTEADLKMPPKKQLAPEQIADLTRWIDQGAVWPAAEVDNEHGQPNAAYDELRKHHWAFQPLAKTSLPATRDATWARNEIDTYVLATLEAQGLAPAGDADRQTLIRRVTFDLTGLPPTPAEVDAFLADSSVDAWDKVVDRLLASPAFGERWGRHWLDVARYGESTGSSRNLPYPHAWRYRDYVIDAVNRDKPYDQFIREQIAGDLLPAANAEQRDEQRIATGFLAIGVKDVNQRFKVRFIMDNIDEQVDAVSRAVLALTASCARCHDHKFDPIPTSDYYALAGIFHSTDLCAGLRNKMGGGGLDYYDNQLLLVVGEENTAPEPDAETAKKIAELTQSVAAAKAEFDALRTSPQATELAPDGRPKRAVARQKYSKLHAELEALLDPAAQGRRIAVGVREAKEIGDTEIRVRGEAEQLGPKVPRGFLSVPNVPHQQIDPSHSGRLELAAWLTSPENPLTPRVFANRVWRHLFGQGLVKTVDNFGVMGDTPSHPLLLDYLATRLIEDEWSLKRLIRTVVRSRTYGLSASTSEQHLAKDPANRWLWRHAPRRLDAEELRDATLAAAGALDRVRAEASPAKELKVVELRNNGPEARKLINVALQSHKRSVYLPVLRGITPRALEVFDFAEQGMVTGSRDTTTVATQALYMLNDPFTRRQSLVLAERLLARTDADDAERVNAAYRLLVGRVATAAEIERTLRYVQEYAGLVAAQETQLASAAPVATAPADDAATTDSGTAANANPAKKKAPQNPDEADQTDEPVVEAEVKASSPRAAAWASFCQALIGSAEFRYLQ